MQLGQQNVARVFHLLFPVVVNPNYYLLYVTDLIPDAIICGVLSTCQHNWYFHDIFTIFLRYSACITSVICVKCRDLRSVITIFSQLMIFLRYFHDIFTICSLYCHDSRYFQDIFRIFSR